MGSPAPQWQRLTECSLVPNKYNDGDSFHVLHEETEYLFRLYFVDCPETDMRFPDRVAEQAAYFNIQSSDVVSIAHLAKGFTEARLATPFIVVTCWQKALGSSKLQRFYAFVFTSRGPLDQLLVQNGLARIYGKRVVLPDGMSSKDYRKKLGELEASAMEKQLGGWRPANSIMSILFPPADIFEKEKDRKHGRRG